MKNKCKNKKVNLFANAGQMYTPGMIQFGGHYTPSYMAKPTVSSIQASIDPIKAPAYVNAPASQVTPTSDSSGLLNGISAGISGVATLAGQVANNIAVPNVQAVTPNSNTADSFMMEQALTGKPNLGKTNVFGATAAGLGAGAATGAGIGLIGGPIGAGIGAAIGGVVGGASGAISSLFGNNQKAKKENRLYEQQKRNFNAKGEEIDNQMFMDSMANYNAFGGQLNSNDVTTFENGGTHEQNPNGGIPQGVDQQGVPNLVEEGETKYKDYIFSNRIIADKKALGALNLPKRHGGKTFGKIADKLGDESKERPNDPISKRGLEDSMGKLQFLQELMNKNKDNKTFAFGGNLFKMGGDTLRYAPIVQAGLATVTDAFGLTNNPDYSNADLLNQAQVSITPDRINNFLEYKPLDVNYMSNQANAQNAATRRSIKESSAGNRATYLATLAAADYGAQKQQGDLYRQSTDYNNQQQMKVADFNRGTNQFNSQITLDADRTNQQFKQQNALSQAQMRENIFQQASNNKSANQNALFQGLGDLGSEQTQRGWLDNLAKAGVYKIDTKGKYIGGNVGACGGKLNTKKK